jgi:glycosyltransferase involved in cell wall biosynthesis
MSRSDLKILFVTAHCPFAASYGAQLRVLNTARLLGKMGTVDLVIAPQDKLDEADLQKTRQEFVATRVVRMENDGLRGLKERIRFELDPAFMKTHFSVASDPDRTFIMNSFDTYDLVWVHTMRTANGFQIYRWPHTVLDVDDIPSQMYSVRAGAGAGMMRRLLDCRMSFIWKRRESLLRDRFDALVVCSEKDRSYLGNVTRINVIPNGFNRPFHGPVHSPTKPARLGFIGLFDYHPNRDGVEWFIKNVWPLIKRKAPDVRLRLIGKGSDSQFSDMGPDIDGLGYVEDSSKEIDSWTAMIVPIRVGGGTRIKIAEAFSRKCPVVSTALGAFGYDVSNEKDLLLADSPQDFASSCLLLIEDDKMGLKLSENAWNLFLHKWTWESMGPAVAKTVEECLKADERARKN